MFRTFFHAANDYVEMADPMDRSVLVDLGKRRRRRVLTAVSLVMALFLLAPWVASSPAAYLWLCDTVPPVAQLISPTQFSDKENGILAQVAGVTRTGGTLSIHITLEDLEGDRLSEVTAPEMWGYWQDKGSSSGRWTREYDPETGLLHLYLTCTPAENLQEYDPDRWITVNIQDLRALSGSSLETIKGNWTVSVAEQMAE